MHTFRFLHQIGTYNIETDRELFESSFVRYTWDKPDLTQEEVDQYIGWVIESMESRINYNNEEWLIIEWKCTRYLKDF